MAGTPGGRAYFILPRIGRTYPGPPPEVEGLVITKSLYSLFKEHERGFGSAFVFRTTIPLVPMLRGSIKTPQIIGTNGDRIECVNLLGLAGRFFYF